MNKNATQLFSSWGLSQDRSVHRIMAYVATRVVREVDERAARSVRTRTASGSENTLVNNVTTAISEPKGGGYGIQLAGAVSELVRVHPGLRYVLDQAMRKESASAPAAEMVGVPEILKQYLPDEVAHTLMHTSGGIKDGWDSLSDEMAGLVVLSRPVIESDPQKSKESCIEALQGAAKVFDNAKHPVAQALSVSVTTPSVQTLITVGAQLPKDNEPGCDEEHDMNLILDCVAIVCSANTPLSRQDMWKELSSRLKSGKSPDSKTAWSRFLRVLRSKYSGEEIAHAFLSQNVAVNTQALDVDRIQTFLSHRALGALASAFITHRDLEQAWQTMNLRGYWELLRWKDFAQLCGAQTNTRITKLLVLTLLKVHERELREAVVRGNLAYDLIKHVLAQPTGEEYGVADIRTKDAELRDFVHKMLKLAEVARSQDEVTDEMLHLVSNMLTSSYATEHDRTLRRVCDACFPQQKCLDVISAAASGSVGNLAVE